MAQREPLFKGPWPVWTLAGVILASYGLQSLLLSDEQVLRFALVPAALMRGDWPPLITDMFLHLGWGHAGINAVGVLAFGAPVARYLGLGPKGVIGFFLLFLVCGVLSSLGYALLHRHDLTPVMGASGAASGLIGAAMRLIDRRGRLSPLFTRAVAASTFGWIVANVVLGLVHYSPGVGDAPVAWEAHVVGYFAGLLLIGPFGALFGEPPPPEEEAIPEEDQDNDGSMQSEG